MIQAQQVIENLGKNMRSRRQELGFSLRKVASLADISVSYVHDLEMGKGSRTSLAAILSIAHALGTDINTLIGNDVDSVRISDKEYQLIAQHRAIFKGEN